MQAAEQAAEMRLAEKEHELEAARSAMQMDASLRDRAQDKATLLQQQVMGTQAPETSELQRKLSVAQRQIDVLSAQLQACQMEVFAVRLLCPVLRCCVCGRALGLLCQSSERHKHKQRLARL